MAIAIVWPRFDTNSMMNMKLRLHIVPVRDHAKDQLSKQMKLGYMEQNQVQEVQLLVSH